MAGKFVKRDGFDEKLDSFVKSVQGLMDEWFKRYENLRPDKITVEPLRRYARIWRTTIHADGSEGQMSSWGFVEYTTGDVFKCHTWKAPAKHPRGNIFSDRNGLEAVNTQGVHVNYLR